jgi:hypothetical protein
VSARRNTIIACALLLLVVLAIVFLFRSSSPKSAALSAREHLLQTLGAEIAKLRPQARVLLLSNPFAEKAGAFNEKTQFERAGIRGLRKGLGKGSSVTVVFPEIRPEYLTNPESISIPSDSRTPLSFVIQPASIDRLADAHPECNVIVSLIGLPVGVQELNIWSEKDPRAFALLMPDLRVVGPPNETLAAFQRGKLLAAVFEDPASAQPLIVTRTNIATILAERPRTLSY